MFCPNCGSEMPEGTRFCGECGSPMGNDIPGQGMPEQRAPQQRMPEQRASQQRIPVQRTPEWDPAGSLEPEKKKWKLQWTILIAVGVIAVGVAGGFLIKSLVGTDSEKENAQKPEVDVLSELEEEKDEKPEGAESEPSDTDSPEGLTESDGGTTENPDASQQESEETSKTGNEEEPEPVQEEVKEEELPLTADLVLEAPVIDNVTLFKLAVADAEASSVISQEGTNNNPILLFDDREDTSWQEGVDGFGIGESIDIELEDTSEVEYLSFKLGNWKNDKYYFGNAKPKTITIMAGEFVGQVTFTGDRTTEWIKFSKPVKVDEISLVIEDVYPGTSWEDTCITEMGIYGF
ncbi:MAG: zinc-ribbon domain-containing protein [Clostridiales bacterium]|nr:zinc-ribbon domain-containing protein [Clostridiales bacterium]